MVRGAHISLRRSEWALLVSASCCLVLAFAAWPLADGLAPEWSAEADYVRNSRHINYTGLASNYTRPFAWQSARDVRGTALAYSQEALLVLALWLACQALVLRLVPRRQSLYAEAFLASLLASPLIAALTFLGLSAWYLGGGFGSVRENSPGLLVPPPLGVAGTSALASYLFVLWLRLSCSRQVLQRKLDPPVHPES